MVEHGVEELDIKIEVLDIPQSGTISSSGFCTCDDSLPFYLKTEDSKAELYECDIDVLKKLPNANAEDLKSRDSANYSISCVRVKTECIDCKPFLLNSFENQEACSSSSKAQIPESRINAPEPEPADSVADSQSSDGVPAASTDHKPYQCDLCDYSSSKRSSLKRHLDSHTEVEPFNREAHMREQYFSCDQCDFKSLTAGPRLKEHLTLHSSSRGEKAYKCELCDQAFGTRGHLAVHMRSHSAMGMEPFKCDLCSYSSNKRSRMTRHVLKHTGLKPFKCDMCKYAAVQKYDLLIHRRKHTGEKPFTCNQCDYKSNRASHLKKHVQTVHNAVKT